MFRSDWRYRPKPRRLPADPVLRAADLVYRHLAGKA